MNFYANILENKEPVLGDPYFLQTKEEIEKWLKKMKIKNYIINDNLTVDVDDNALLSEKKIKKIPVKFNNINGSFHCVKNQLTSLKGCPEKILNGHFVCEFNEITSLEYFPKEVSHGGYLTIINCGDNKLTSLKGCIQDLSGKYFYCGNNQLNSLEYLPIAKRYDINNNPLKTLKKLSVMNLDLLEQLFKIYPKLDWKEIEWDKVKNMNEIITDVYSNVEKFSREDEDSPGKLKWEGILRRFEELQLY